MVRIQHIDPDDADAHQIVIDASAPNTDQSHVYLSGGISTDEYFISCYNPIVVNGDRYGKTVFTINGYGDVECSTDLANYR